MIDSFIAARKARWDRLDLLLGRIRRGELRRLGTAEIEEFGRLYRETASDLALSRRDFPHAPVTAYLNSLVGQAHPYVYARRDDRVHGLLHFFVRDFPQAFRRSWRLVLVSFLAFILPAVLAYGLSMRVDTAASVLAPPGLEDRLEQVRESGRWADISAAESSIAATTIMTNNIRVAILAFGGGILVGLPTLLVLSMNGLMLGSVAALAQKEGVALELWSFVSPHGWIELSVIFIAGGAGLGLARAVLLPGLSSRTDALVAAAQEAVRLLLGGAALLVVAGLIEGVISPSLLPAPFKFVFGVLTCVVLYAYLLLAGRGHAHTDNSLGSDASSGRMNQATISE